MYGRGRKNSINLLYPLLDPARKRRRLHRWLPVVLVVVFLFSLGYSLLQLDQQKGMLRIHLSMHSETVSRTQSADIGTLSTEGTNSSEDSSSESAEKTNIYSETTSTHVDEHRFAGIPERVYVPNVADGTVDVIDPETFEVVDHYAVGEIPHHVTPSWNMKKLYVSNEASSSLTVIDPNSGKPTSTVLVPYPYNLYFTPDGKKAIGVVERL